MHISWPELTKELTRASCAPARLRCSGAFPRWRGATREEVMEAMGLAVYMGAGPSVCTPRTQWRHSSSSRQPRPQEPRQADVAVAWPRLAPG